MRIVNALLLSHLLTSTCFAALPVTLAGPNPSIPGQIPAGYSQVHVFVLTNNVPGLVAPLTILGLEQPVTRVPVANDCGNVLPRGPAQCNLGFLIEPQSNDFGVQIFRELAIDYQDRVPFLVPFEFVVSGEPAVFALAGFSGLSSNPTALVASSNDGAAAAFSVKPITGLPGGATQLSAVSCAGNGATAVCAGAGALNPSIDAVTPILVNTQNGGSTWNVISAPESNGPLSAASCIGNEVGAAFCVVGGFNILDGFKQHPYVAISFDGGGSYTTVVPSGDSTLPAFGIEFASLSCTGNARTGFCAGVGNGEPMEGNPTFFILASQDDLRRWKNFGAADSRRENPMIMEVSCTGHKRNGFCIAVGSASGGVHKTLLIDGRNAGQTWVTNLNVTGNELNTVSCTGSEPNAVCVIGGRGGTLIVKKNAGGGGGVHHDIASIGSLFTSSCTGSGATATCVVAGGIQNGAPTLAMSTDGGTNWFVPTLAGLPTKGVFTATRCQGTGSSTICIAAGINSATNGPFLYKTTNNGALWTIQAVTGAPAVGEYLSAASTE